MLEVKLLEEMATEAGAADRGACSRCGCHDTRMLLAPDGRRFRGCRFCGTPRPALVETQRKDKRK